MLYVRLWRCSTLVYLVSGAVYDGLRWSILFPAWSMFVYGDVLRWSILFTVWSMLVYLVYGGVYVGLYWSISFSLGSMSFACSRF